MTLIIVAIASLALGMACPFIAFLVFKPVLKMYADTMNNYKRLTDENVVDRVFARFQGIPTVHEKAKKTVVRPKRDTDEGDS